MLKVPNVAVALGVGQAGAYELAHSEGFPVLKVGSRIVIPKDKFLLWIERQCGQDAVVLKLGMAVKARFPTLGGKHRTRLYAGHIRRGKAPAPSLPLKGRGERNAEERKGGTDAGLPTFRPVSRYKQRVRLLLPSQIDRGNV